MKITEIECVPISAPSPMRGEGRTSNILLVKIHTDEGITGIGDGGVQVPKEFALYQNYPNPFNPTTTIRYDVKQSTEVKLVIYNMLGQEVRTLVNNRQDAGYKTVVWDGLNNRGSRVASGIYIYRLQAGDFVQARKMILMK